MKGSAASRVAICIATYRRPRMLATLLKALDRLTFRKMPEPRVTVVVIDNDADASAQESVERAAGRARWPLCYGIESRRGISYARNRAIAAAGKDCDFVVFIDDDEVPRRNWLDELLFVQANQNADVVAGPVVARFEALPPAWIERGRCFERPRYRSGQQPAVAGAGNVLIRASQLDGLSGPFDARFALSGAEDTHLFMRLRMAGGRMVWADEAMVEERVPNSRMNWKWVLQRAYRGGNGYALCELDLHSGRGVRWRRAVKGAARIAQGVGLLTLAPAYGVAGLVSASARVCLGVGMLAGVLGYRYEEYRHVHGA
jgi:succinoglycan biosynthesis protein ExoM